MNNFKKKAICLAIGATMAVPATSLMAAEVGNFFHTEGKSKLQIGVFYNYSSRDVEQDGKASYLTEVDSFEVVPGVTETNSSAGYLEGLGGEQDTEDLYLKISYALTPKIELYGKAGVSSTDVDIDDDGTDNFSESTSITEDGGVDFSDSSNLSEGLSQSPFTEDVGSTHDSDTGWLVGVGTKITIFSTNGWNVGLDGQYIYREQDVGEAFLAGGDWELGDHESHELQGSLLLGKVVGNFRPYAGVSYTKYESEYDIDFTGGPIPPSINVNGGTLEFENEDNVGFFAGFDFDLPGLTVSFEARGGDEESANLGVRMPL